MAMARFRREREKQESLTRRDITDFICLWTWMTTGGFDLAVANDFRGRSISTETNRRTFEEYQLSFGIRVE